MSISFGGVGELCVTFKTDGSVTKGCPVKMIANDTVAACADGNRFIGVVIDAADDGYATVQLAGFVTMGYTGTAPSVGFANLAANSTGGVKTATSGGECLILDVNTSDNTVGFII